MSRRFTHRVSLPRHRKPAAPVLQIRTSTLGQLQFLGSILTGRYQQRDDVSDHLYVGVMRGAPGTLQLGYGFGGKVSCD